MDSVQQVILVLKVVLLVAPPAMYFVVLGLLNSQPTPRLVNARSDFLVLTAALGPVLLAAVPGVVRSGYGWLLVPAFAAVALGMRALMPPAGGGWVIYNLSSRRARVLLERCFRQLGWAYRDGDRDDALEVPGRGLTIRLSPLPVLRNVTCHLAFTADTTRAQTTAALRARLTDALKRQQQLPSLAGSSLLLVGVGMMILPLWMMTRHSDAIAEVVSRLLLS